MSLADILHDIGKMEEMKKSTPVTAAVLQSALKMSAVLEGEDLGC